MWTITMAIFKSQTEGGETLHLMEIPRGDTSDGDKSGENSSKCPRDQSSTGDRRSNYDEISDSDKHSSGSERNIWLGYGMMLLLVTGDIIGMACVSVLDRSVPHWELNGLRFTVSLVLVVFPVVLKKCDVRLERHEIAWVATLCVMITAHNYGAYGNLYYLPIGVASGIESSLTVIFSYTTSCICDRILKWQELVAVVLCLIGILLVTQPHFIFLNEDTSSLIASVNSTSHPSVCYVSPHNVTMYDNSTVYWSHGLTQHPQALGYVLCVVSASTLVADMYICKEKLSDMSVLKVTFWASLFGVISSFSIMAMSETPYFPTLSLCVGLLFLHIVQASLGSVTSFVAFQNLDSVVCSLLLTVEIAVASILQYTLLSAIHPGNANGVEIVGLVLILTGNVLVPIFMIIKQIVNKQ